jgi:hypothetical protein
MDAFTGPMVETSSHPNGMAPTNIWLPLTAGGMTGVTRPAFEASLNLLKGAAVSGAFDAAFDANGNAAVYLTLSGAFTLDLSASADLRVVLGLSGSWASGMAITGTMSMQSTLSGAWSADVDMNVSMIRERLAMSGEWGGASPLSPAGLAGAVWAAVAATNNDAGSMGEKLNAAGSASNPWTDPSGEAVLERITELWRVHGLKPGEPMTVTQAQRIAGDIVQVITGDGTTTTTVTRSP